MNESKIRPTILKCQYWKKNIITKYYLTIFNYKGISVLFLKPWQHKQVSSYKYISQLLGILESMQGNVTGQESKR